MAETLSRLLLLLLFCNFSLFCHLVYPYLILMTGLCFVVQPLTSIGGHVARTENMRYACRILTAKT